MRPFRRRRGRPTTGRPRGTSRCCACAWSDDEPARQHRRPDEHDQRARPEASAAAAAARARTPAATATARDPVDARQRRAAMSPSRAGTAGSASSRRACRRRSRSGRPAGARARPARAAPTTARSTQPPSGPRSSQSTRPRKSIGASPIRFRSTIRSEYREAKTPTSTTIHTDERDGDREVRPHPLVGLAAAQPPRPSMSATADGRESARRGSAATRRGRRRTARAAPTLYDVLATTS